ncbi:hypothetical protein A5630_08840 [Mycolicibacterium mucogenicum]|uniref:Class I SAM-dependent methyltransferase n=1 Tax=Mycolicibacterium mucogenicum TaxID=56689 RepID=A0A1A3GJV8_MYCMU|nr:hypothetical protein [Mycolicibacterium mucogenicum]OBJ35701.1 hypothetical protein A5630_08840 [Mycolicibacterium mucogenicum]
MRVADKVDQALQGRLRRIFWRVGAGEPIRERIEDARLRKRNPFAMEISYGRDDASVLAALCELHGSDKGEVQKGGKARRRSWPTHTYTDFYEMLFGQKREAVRSVIECGLGTNNPSRESSMGVTGTPGASLRVWREYFPHADVVGIDIDKDILFTEDRIRTYYCDQTDASSVQEFKSAAAIPAGSVDVIIDDGLHKFHAGKCLFENTFDLLKDDGVYIIEDVTLRDRQAYDEYFSDCRQDLVFQIVRLHRPGIALWDNSLIVIRKKSSALNSLGV